ncbi:hypothetical protein PIB30_065282 [Stylosanthes scabra]|uniref:Uncharacterized protein n=1 Tax=Stylosanthes scabra TaxID=79078 RepID=A0ABU6YJI3_9FABA|nr:hypothetical protein [Stylosanthes scabra]
MEKKNAGIVKRTQKTVEEEVIIGGWVCVLFREQLKKFVVGGYVKKKEGKVIGYKGQLVEVKSEKEAKIEGINVMVQFCFEEVCVKKEKLSIVVDDNKLVGWIQGKEEVPWELRFIRNKARGIKDLFLNIKLSCRENGKFNSIRGWID